MTAARVEMENRGSGGFFPEMADQLNMITTDVRR